MFMKPAPNRLLPNWAIIYGLQPNPMQMYCTGVKIKNKLPRGMEPKCGRLREDILKKIRLKSINTYRLG